VTVERSHGKARPTLPRSSDLPVVGTDRERTRGRDAAGRFSHGNEGGRGRGWKRAIVKMLGRDIDDPTALAVAADAWRLFCASIREMPSDGPTVRSLVALRCRHEALAAFFHARAAENGLDSAEGIKATDIATKHGQRAERLAVTSIDVAARLAHARESRDSHATPWLLPASPAPAAPSRTRTTEPPAGDDDAADGNVGAGRGGEP
jgi:hypothetical protein